MTNRQVKIDKKKLYALVVKQKDKTAVVPTHGVSIIGKKNAKWPNSETSLGVPK